MIVLNLYNEVSDKAVNVIVSNKQYSIVKDLQHAGGFRRFGMAIYDDKVKAQKETQKLIDFLCSVFDNKPLITKMFN